MMSTAHAVSGASVWLAGWSWAAVAGVAQPRADVLLVGTLVCAGAALYPDIDHPSSRIARSGSVLTKGIARLHAFAGRRLHALTKLAADRADLDGHRTISHTLVFAVLVGAVCAGLAARFGAWGCAALVYVFTALGVDAVLAGRPVRVRRTRTRLFGQRLSRGSCCGLGAAAGAYLLVPGGTWWLGLAVAVGCLAHCCGDALTASGCPMLWPLPIPARTRRRVRGRKPGTVWVWRTWYLVGTPQWMRFRVGSPAETAVTVLLAGLAALAAAGLVYAAGRPA